MFEYIDLEFQRQQLQGHDSDIQLLQDNDSNFKKLLLLTTDCPISRKFDVAVGAYVNKFTVRLDTDEKVAAFNSSDALDLRIGARTTRYALEAKIVTSMHEIQIGYADLRLISNERTQAVD